MGWGGCGKPVNPSSIKGKGGDPGEDDDDGNGSPMGLRDQAAHQLKGLGPPPGLKGKGKGKGWEKGWGKPAKGSWGVQQNQDEELLWTAVYEAVQPIKHMEDELDESKLEKRIRDAFKKGAKGLNVNARSWPQAVEEFADGAMSSLFSSCGDKPWLAHIDLLLCLDAGIRDNFPPQVMRNVPAAEFEQCVLAAYERAFEEQRTGPIMWEAVQAAVEGKKSRTKWRMT